jgi:hypothetical protein
MYGQDASVGMDTGIYASYYLQLYDTDYFLCLWIRSLPENETISSTIMLYPFKNNP